MDAHQIADFVGQLNGRGMGQNPRTDLANCGLIANAIPID